MKFLIENFKCCFYLFLLSTKQVNDFRFLRNFDFNTSSNYHHESENTTLSFHQKSSLNICNTQIKDFKFSPCLISLVPCGDFNDWRKLPSAMTINRNSTYLNIDYYAHKNLAIYRQELTERLNKINIFMKKTDIINIVQEKRLGQAGNSYYYQKHVRQLDVPDNAYVSFNHFEHQQKYAWNQPVLLKERTCDFSELSLYDPARHVMIRKSVTRDYFDMVRKDFSDLFLNEISAKLIPSAKTDNPVNTTCIEHPILSELKSFKPNVSLPLMENIENTTTFNQTQSVKLNSSAQIVKNYDLKFMYKFDGDKVDELNQMYKKYLKVYSLGEDNLVNYAIIQDKVSKEIYMHMRTRLGKHYLNNLISASNIENKFLFKFKKTTSLTIRIKSIESWNLIRYEIYIPFPNCTAINNNQNYHQSYSATDFINCDNFDEKLFFDQLNQRGKIY